MATPALVQTFPYVAWILIAGLAFGSFALVVLTKQVTDATIGYLRFGAIGAAILALLTRVVDDTLTTPDALAIAEAPQNLYTLRWIGLVLFIACALAYAILVRRPRVAPLLGGAGIALGLGTLGAAAFGWAATAPDAVPLLIQLGVLSVATGGSMAAIALGHWYLVTPKLSVDPLVFQCRLLLGVLTLQILLFVVWTTLGGGPGQAAFDAFSGGSVILVGLRLVVTLLFPLALCYMALRTAQTRSMESATGLLYINLAAVMAGTIGAAALYVSGGLLV